MRFFGIAICAAALAFSRPSVAAPALTQAGIDLGFTLSTFFSSGGTWDVLNVTAAADGALIASSYSSFALYKFAEGNGNTVDNNTLSSVAAANYALYPGQPTGIATAAGAVYVAILDGGVYRVNSNTLSVSNINMTGAGTMRYGLAGLSNGNLIAATSGGVFIVDPNTGGTTKISNLGNNDGVSVSPDGSIAYVEAGNDIYAVSIANPNPTTPLAVYTAAHANGADGTAVISSGALAGQVVVSNNDGTIGLINPADSSYVTIASGMARGDLIGPDANNGTVLVTDNSQVLRLGLLSGTIGGSSEVPEPTSLALFGGGLVTLRWARRRRARGEAT